jgi:hypothetical protein
MGQRLPTVLPRIAVLVLVALAASAGLTFAAGKSIQSSTPSTAAAPAAARRLETIVVPDLRHQAFVFAKQQLADAGFAWKVVGPVQGFAANTVVTQSPAPGTKLFDTGAPLITLTLARNGSYPQDGSPDNASSYPATADRRVDVSVAPAPKITAPKAAAPTVTTAPATTTAQTTTTTAATDKAPAQRPPDFVVPGAKKEPLNEIPLPDRAARLGDWIGKHPKPTDANVKYWLYQNAWVVAGARMGWWHGADALRTLIAVDQRTESVWGIGANSENVARRALAEVEARKK